jgi:hypothetical protein
MKSVCTSLLAFTGLAAAVSKYDEYILAPKSRTIHPVAVYQDKVNGTIIGADSLASDSPGSAIFQGVSAVTYDFGINIGGLVSLNIGNKTDTNQSIAITYSESSQWISGVACDATQDSGMDEALWFYPQGPGVVSVDRQHERGGFRYLSLIHNTTGDIEITEVTVEFTPSPTTEDLRNYTGFFHSDDELLNRIWYAGAYTIQVCNPHHLFESVQLMIMRCVLLIQPTAMRSSIRKRQIRVSPATQHRHGHGTTTRLSPIRALFLSMAQNATV